MLERYLKRAAKQSKARLYFDGLCYVIHRQGYDWALFFRPTSDTTCGVSKRWHDPFAIHNWII